MAGSPERIASRSFTRVYGDIWLDRDWRALSTRAQCTYLMLLTSPSITLAGTMPLQMVKWSRMSAEQDPVVVEECQIATTPETSRRMAAQASRDTRIELLLRQQLHARGLRYRVHTRPVRDLRRVADIVFPRARVAVFVDGCFWHGCPTHGTWPTRNAQFWKEKIDTNVMRDRATDTALAAAGWLPVRVWEHEDLATAAQRVEALVRRRVG
jgi:DNA mismatch endonuclease, patch repair protein